MALRVKKLKSKCVISTAVLDGPSSLIQHIEKRPAYAGRFYLSLKVHARQ